MSKIIYTGSFRLPDLDAAAKRVILVGNCLKENGYEVLYLGWENGSNTEKKEYKGFNYYSMSEFNKIRYNIFNKIYGLFRGIKTVCWLLRHKSILQEAEAIILYNPPAIFTILIILLAKKYQLKVILDSTEWYDSSHLPGGRFGAISLENQLRMKYSYLKIKNIICISTYLRNYYNNTNSSKNLLVLPALSEHSVIPKRQNISKIVLMYAGNMGQKDSLLEVINTLPILNDRHPNKNIELHLYGPSYNEIEGIISSQSLHASKDYIKYHGRVSFEQVIQSYSSADFSILFREDKQYAHAGFPTKAIESWSCGVPIITNAIGDLQLYCNHNNSLITSPNDLQKNLEKLIQEYDYERKNQLSLGSLSTFENYFSVKQHVDTVGKFMSKLQD